MDAYTHIHTHTGETCLRARQASRRGDPLGASLMVFGACGYCAVAHVWINVFLPDRDDVTVKLY